MDLTFIALIAVILYLTAGLLQLLCVHDYVPRCKWLMVVCGFAAICLQGLLLHQWIDSQNGQNLNFVNLLSLTTWLVSVLVLALVTVKRIEVLAIFIFPIAALSILLILIFPSQYIVDTGSHLNTLFHILLSILTFCVLVVAGLLAVLLAIQERLLRFRPSGYLLPALPPLESMEVLLFQVISFGFVLLNVVLVTSLYFYHTILWEHVGLIQKTILVIAGWLVFAILLVGRHQEGWRGNKAIYYTLFGLALLFVAYLGSGFVNISQGLGL